MISRSGYYIDPKATEAVTTLKDSIPKTEGEVRRLVDLFGMYRRHIKDFARIAKPINELLDGKHQKVRNFDDLRRDIESECLSSLEEGKLSQILHTRSVRSVLTVQIGFQSGKLSRMLKNQK
jgi:hypothetical protein